jgi:hypothetical protein
MASDARLAHAGGRRMSASRGEGFAADIGVLVEAAIEARGRLGPELLEYGNPLIGHRTINPTAPADARCRKNVVVRSFVFFEEDRKRQRAEEADIGVVILDDRMIA